MQNPLTLLVRILSLLMFTGLVNARADVGPWQQLHIPTQLPDVMAVGNFGDEFLVVVQHGVLRTGTGLEWEMVCT